jgi:hypothetical protein
MPCSLRASATRWLLTLLAASLTSCAAQSPPPLQIQPPALPAVPADLMEPPEPGTWSDSVRELLSRWRKLLTGAKVA